MKTLKIGDVIIYHGTDSNHDDHEEYRIYKVHDFHKDGLVLLSKICVSHKKKSNLDSDTNFIWHLYTGYEKIWKDQLLKDINSDDKFTCIDGRTEEWMLLSDVKVENEKIKYIWDMIHQAQNDIQFELLKFLNVN